MVNVPFSGRWTTASGILDLKHKMYRLSQLFKICLQQAAIPLICYFSYVSLRFPGLKAVVTSTPRMSRLLMQDHGERVGCCQQSPMNPDTLGPVNFLLQRSLCLQLPPSVLEVIAAAWSHSAGWTFSLALVPLLRGSELCEGHLLAFSVGTFGLSVMSSLIAV